MKALASRLGVALLALLALGVVGCEQRADAPGEPRKLSVREQKLTVFAASSLREAFESLGRELAGQHPGLEISFNFAGTQQLRTQLEQGAVADVFASADQRHMKELVNAGRVIEPHVFARNELVLVVDPAQASLVTSLLELPKATRIVVGAPEVPVGKYSLTLFDNADKAFGGDFRKRVEAHVVSRELNVRQVLAKVTLGEADAGVVYRTDVATAKQPVTVVEIPPSLNVVAEYPIGIVKDAPHPELSREWVTLVLSDAGRVVLERQGFSPARPAASP